MLVCSINQIKQNLFFFFQMLGKQTKSALAIPVPSDKEPAGRRASGLAHLMTALHQNAAAVVNSKTQLNGPDQVRVLRSGYTKGGLISEGIVIFVPLLTKGAKFEFCCEQKI